MTENRVVKGTRELALLAGQLARCPKVAGCDGENESWELTHCFESLEWLFVRFVEEKLPRLMDPRLSEEEICGVLYEIGADLQQVVYHIGRPRFYKYLEGEDVAGGASMKGAAESREKF